MENHFVKTAGVEALEKLLSRSQEEPIVVFKHSTTCPISAGAYNEMEQYEGEVALVEVQTARDLSQAIEKTTGISHESPQVLILSNGKVVWDASHWKIKADAVAKAVSEARNR
ncbi:MAG: bacillithiol system redox-active protein YtxJ [bacterium]